MSRVYESHVRDGVYSGDDAVLQECFIQAKRLRQAAQFMNALLAVGKQMKGMLNEDQYDDRLGENRNRPDALLQIVRQQEVRRCEYFRMRVLLQYHILPVVADALQRCVTLTGTVNGRRLKEPSEQNLSLDEYSALGEILSAVSEEEVFTQYDRALEFISEPDATGGKGEKALEREAMTIDGYITWRETILPLEFQLVESPYQHDVDRALMAEIRKIEPILISSRQEVTFLEGFDQCRRGGSKFSATRQILRWPEILWRVSHYTRVGSEYDGYDPGWRDQYATTFYMLLDDLRSSFSTMNQRERWLAQSNSIGASYRIVKFLQPLEAGAFNMTIGASQVGGTLRKLTNDLIGKFLKDAEGLKFE